MAPPRQSTRPTRAPRPRRVTCFLDGQLPAYEWAFGDVNPPVHAWASWRGSFKKLLLNFTWWVNRKDSEGRNVFQGGFLGLDNIGVFDRSAPLPTGGHIERRMTRIFLKGPDGRRPVHGNNPTYHEDPNRQDLILFYEYSHGDNGSGVGASHQTGWTGVVAKLLQQSGERVTPAGLQLETLELETVSGD